jgi:hypothetical protein
MMQKFEGRGLNAALFLDDATADNNYYEQIAERGFTLR